MMYACMNALMYLENFHFSTKWEQKVLGESFPSFGLPKHDSLKGTILGTCVCDFVHLCACGG